MPFCQNPSHPLIFKAKTVLSFCQRKPRVNPDTSTDLRQFWYKLVDAHLSFITKLVTTNLDNLTKLVTTNLNNMTKLNKTILFLLVTKTVFELLVLLDEVRKACNDTANPKTNK